MDLKRMKFAWARGAWLQHKHVMDDVRYDLPRSTPPVYEEADRIHPDCAHLEYGPLSTALREAACNPAHAGVSTLIAAKYACGGLLHEDAFGLLHRASPHESCMYLLFLAELLADEGL